MIRYQIIKPVEIPKGYVVELTREQALPRLLNLKPLKGHTYEVKSDISFKAGEIIGFDPGRVKAFTGSMAEQPRGKK